MVVEKCKANEQMSNHPLQCTGKSQHHIK